MSRKKRILLVNEASYLNTGYSTYGLNVMKRLYATGKYELAEFAAYGHYGDPRRATLPWGFYGNLPNLNDEKLRQEHDAVPQNQFGQWRFEDVCLDFQPDICWSIRDIWMDMFIFDSPFRPYYNFVTMPPVDSAPQDEQWIDTFSGADNVATYTDFGAMTLKEQTGGSLISIGALTPSADFDIYKPVANKQEHKKLFGLSPDTLIVGTVMRNQRRKLFPDLFQAFRLFLEKNENTALAERLYLYCHTSWPDNGWDLPRILKESGIGHKVLFSYICRSCGKIFPAFYQETKTFCPFCKKLEAGMPNTQVGASTEQLSQIYNLFDVYVQYAICEGAGMPSTEAAACGVPVFAVDYSGMQHILKYGKGTPIRVERFFRESETHSWRALPDNADFVGKLTKFLNLPEPLRLRKGHEAAEGVRKHITWDQAAAGWEKAFDSLPLRSEKETWKSPPKLFEPNRNVPANLTNAELVDWAIVNVLGDPSKLNTYFSMRLLRDLNSGSKVENFGGAWLDENAMLGNRTRWQEWGRDNMLQMLYEMRLKKNHWEKERCTENRSKPDYIAFARVN